MRISPNRAFSLTELLIVIAIMAVLAGLAAPAVTTMMRGTQLNRAGDKTAAVLSLARQAALSKNQMVEVRFYQYGDPEVPGETVSSPATGKYRAIQAFQIDDVGKATPITRSEVLPPSIILDSGATLSSLLDPAQSKTSWSTNDPQITIPRVGTSYNCKAFRFLPDGSINLSKTAKWFVTMHNKIDGDARTAPPSNFITVQIDPVNGALKTWQP